MFTSEYALDLVVSAVERKEFARERSVSPSNELVVGDRGTCNENLDGSEVEGAYSTSDSGNGDYVRFSNEPKRNCKEIR